MDRHTRSVSQDKTGSFVPGDRNILNDYDIAELCKGDRPMLSPFEPRSVKNIWVKERDEQAVEKKVISYGLSSFGYDIRLGTQFRRPWRNIVLDPKQNTTDNAETWEHINTSDPIWMKPNSVLMGVSVEWFDMPVDVMAISCGKSTYGRSGLIANISPIEPAWKGNLTIALINPTNNDIIVYPNEGITQLVFFRGYRPDTTYEEKGGKYQGAVGIVGGKV